MGGNEMIMRSLLSERRAQESAADQAGLRFLDGDRQSGRGMLETFERFAQQEYTRRGDQDPFVRSHPVAADRLARLRQLAEFSPYVSAKDPPQLQLRHDMMRAKLSGYIDRPAGRVQPLSTERYNAAGALCARPSPAISKAGRTRSKPIGRGRCADP